MIFTFLILLCLYLPFQIALNPAAGVDLASIRILVLVFFFLWLAKGLKDRKVIIGNNLLAALIVIFLFLNFLSFFHGDNPTWSARKLLFLFSLFPIFFVVSGIVTDANRALKIIKALAISGATVAAVGIIQFFSQFVFGAGSVSEFWANFIAPPFLGANLTEAVLKYPSWMVNISGLTFLRTTSVFPDPHMFSMYLGLLWPVSACLAILTKKKRWLFGSFLILLGNILTFSRGGYLGLIGGLLFALIILIPRLGKQAKLAFLILALMFFMAVTIPGPISSRFAATFDFSEGSNAGRIEMWKTAADLISKHPIRGVGIGNFSAAVNPIADYREPIYAHNTYLDISAEAGIFAGLIWIGIILASIWNNFKRRQNILRIGLAAGLIIFSLHSLFETGIYSPTVLTLLIIFLGLSNAEINEKNIKF